MSVKIFSYKRCGTCRKATKFFEENNIAFEEVPIREQTPSQEELEKMLNAYEGNIKKLFNTSGQDYRALGIKDQIADMSQQEALDLLRSNGNLIKRPFVLSEKTATVGFKEDVWQKLFL
jgi:arsenate reductase